MTVYTRAELRYEACLWRVGCVLCVALDLREVADLRAQFTLHAIDGALELNQLSVQQAGVMFVFGELQDDVT